MALAVTRQEMIQKNDLTHFIRLALPREDRVHKTLAPWISRDGVLVNLSADLVVEDANGNFVKDYQVKAISERKFEADMERRALNKGKMVYPKERLDMIFLKSDDELLAQTVR